MSGKMAAGAAQSVAEHDGILRESQVSRDAHHTHQSQALQPAHSGVLDLGNAIESAFHAATSFLHKPGIDEFRPLPDTSAPPAERTTTNRNGVTVDTQNNAILSNGHLVRIPEKAGAAIQIRGVTEEGVVVGNYCKFGKEKADDKFTPFLAFVDAHGHLNLKENPKQVLNGPGDGREYEVTEFLGMQGNTVIARTPDYTGDTKFLESRYARLQVSP